MQDTIHPLCYRYARYSWLCVVPTLDGIPNTRFDRAGLCTSINAVYLWSETAQVKYRAGYYHI